MGQYRYINQEQTKRLKSVGDTSLNILFREAQQHCDTLLIEEHVTFVRKKGIKGLFGAKECEYRYTVLHEERSADGSAYQAEYMNFCYMADKKMVVAYLFGIIWGSLAAIERM